MDEFDTGKDDAERPENGAWSYDESAIYEASRRNDEVRFYGRELTDVEEEQQPLPQEGLYGLGGWLIWFQIRIYFGFISAIGVMGLYGTDFFMLACMGLLIVCLVLFYKRKLSFRIWYIAAMGLNIVGYLYYYSLGLTSALSSMTAYIIVEGLMITALFRSRRVKNTFR